MSTIPQQYEQHPTSDIPLPPGAVFADVWEGTPPERVVHGRELAITDSDVRIGTTAIQRADGSISDGPEPPYVHIDGCVQLNSDQCRELAAVLLGLAAEIAGWTR
jgi:hypothetical protein